MRFVETEVSGRSRGTGGRRSGETQARGQQRTMTAQAPAASAMRASSALTTSTKGKGQRVSQDCKRQSDRRQRERQRSPQSLQGELTDDSSLEHLREAGLCSIAIAKCQYKCVPEDIASSGERRTLTAKVGREAPLPLPSVAAVPLVWVLDSMAIFRRVW